MPNRREPLTYAMVDFDFAQVYGLFLFIDSIIYYSYVDIQISRKLTITRKKKREQQRRSNRIPSFPENIRLHRPVEPIHSVLVLNHKPYVLA